MEFVQNHILVSPFVHCDLQEEGDDDLMFKMVFVVNMDLAMGVGKVSLVLWILHDKWDFNNGCSSQTKCV